MSNQYFFPNGASYEPPEKKTESTSTSRSNKNASLKPIENPLLMRSPPFSASTSMIQHQQQPPSLFASSSSLSNQENKQPSLLDEHAGSGGGGLRQRRKGGASATGALPPPPRASLSLGTTLVDPVIREDYRSAAAPLLLSTSTHTNSVRMPTPSLLEDSAASAATLGCWVLVYGYSNSSSNNNSHSDLMRRFAAQGEIVETRSLGQNGMALKYASPLQAAKVACHDVVYTADGVYCGVKALDDGDPLLLQQQHRNFQQNHLWLTSSSSETENSGKPSNGTATNGDSLLLLAGSHHHANGNGHAMTNGAPEPAQGDDDDVLHERDILLVKHPPPARKRKDASLCERLLRWVLSIPDE